MIRAPGTFLGSSFATAVLAEVIPLVILDDGKHQCQSPPRLSSPIVKHRLQEWTLRSIVRAAVAKDDERVQDIKILPVECYKTIEKISGSDTINEISHAANPTSSDSDCSSTLQAGYLRVDYEIRNQNEGGEINAHTAILIDNQETNSIHIHRNFPIVYLPSDDPLQIDPLPCQVRVYTPRSQFTPSSDERIAIVTDSTLVRVLPPHLAVYSDEIYRSPPPLPPSWFHSDRTLHRFSAELPSIADDALDSEVMAVHGEETIKLISSRMGQILSQPVDIGTTATALSSRQRRKSKTRAMFRSIDRFIDQEQAQEDGVGEGIEKPKKKFVSEDAFSRDPTLLVHSPDHASGKTLLVKAVARKRLGCSDVYVLSAPALIAKYGVYADEGLESWLHSILVSAAASNRQICIILDHLESMLPPRLSGCTSAGDAAVPILHSIASILKSLAISMRQCQQVPFPVQNKLYNESESSGYMLAARFCLVGIVTCPDNGWKSRSDVLQGKESILDALGGGRFRLPDLDGKSRLSALQYAIQKEEIALAEDALSALPEMATKAVWTRGGHFQRIAKILRSNLQDKEGRGSLLVANAEHVKLAISSARKSMSGIYAKVDVQSTSEGYDSTALTPESGTDLFQSVGGNAAAKQSLKDALALDPAKRQLLRDFGMSPPIGILLYGPPGCGKTLLAKAVARLLSSQGSSSRNSTSLGSNSMSGSFISLSSSDIVRAEIGTSEKLVVDAFEMARKSAPSVIFIDEFQALFTDRSSSGSSKLASTLLQCMDDVRRWGKIDRSVASSDGDNGRIVVLGATNTPWAIDKAFLRTGRFDRVVHVALPTRDERQSILRVHMRRMKLKAPEELEAISLRIASRCEGLSGADLAAVCRSAAIRCLLEGEVTNLTQELFVEERHFASAIENDVHASSDKKLVDRLLRWRP